MTLNIRFTWQSLFILLFAFLFVTACAPDSDEGGAAEGREQVGDNDEVEHDEDVEHEDEPEHDENEEHERVSNEGAAVHIVSPEDGAVFAVDEEVVVEIELENFTLGDGNHWHVYIDGSSWGMVLGENQEQVLRGLEPGEHEIAVYLSVDTHEELEEGDEVTITVEE